MPFGFLNIDKPSGMTSHDVVNRVRRVMHTKQVGHAGTLDPMATGVLIVCVGAATRLSEYAMSDSKAYRAVVHFGIETDTYDAEGQITREADASRITRELLDSALGAFRGDILQVPPMYSAIKKDGRKLYDLARKGETVEIPPRPVTIHQIDVIDWQSPRAALDVRCSAGTYIRSLAHDLGAALGVGAHLAGLTRTASGMFRLADAVPLDTLIASDDPTAYLIAPRRALADKPSVVVSAEGVEHLKHGRAIRFEHGSVAQSVNKETSPPALSPQHFVRGEGEQVVNLTGRMSDSGQLERDSIVLTYDGEDDLIAICHLRDGMLYPHKVFAGTSETTQPETDNS